VRYSHPRLDIPSGETYIPQWKSRPFFPASPPQFHALRYRQDAGFFPHRIEYKSPLEAIGSVSVTKQ
jgi:hypothetical protein